MKIRKMIEQDTEEVLQMMRVFYDSPAVLHKAPNDILRQDIADCMGDCPFIEGYVFMVDQEIAGYSMVAKSYSTEFGGLCVWIEDLYIKPEFRNCGIGSEFFKMLNEQYQGTAVRFRLEVEEENESAVHVYEKNGFKRLPYVQMTKENSNESRRKNNE